jgi:hypothetical protein
MLCTSLLFAYRETPPTSKKSSQKHHQSTLQPSEMAQPPWLQFTERVPDCCAGHAAGDTCKLQEMRLVRPAAPTALRQHTRSCHHSQPHEAGGVTQRPEGCKASTQGGQGSCQWYNSVL